MKQIMHYAKLLELGKISRREFIGRATAFGVTAALASTMASKALKAASPKMGGHLRIGIGAGSTADSLDPANFTDSYMQWVGYALRNHLTEVGNDGKLIPELCSGWSASDDAVQWTFELRRGVEFHNGKTMEADDVVASFNHHRGEDSKSAAKGVVDPIKDLKADGKNTVVFTLAEGNADFPYIASDYHIPIMPSKDGKIDWQSGVGTGGYVLENFDPGVRTSFKRNPNYWKEGKAHVDSGEALVIADVVARTNGVTTGELDAMDRCDIKTLNLLERNKDIRIEETTGNQHYTAPMFTDVAPFDDNNVRMALKLGLDREALLRTVLRGHGALGNDHPIGTSNPYHASDLPQRAYDPDKARWHLKQAGLTSLSVNLSASDAAFAGAVDAAVLYKEHASKAGIDITVIREPADGYWSNVWMVKPWCMSYWGGRPTADWMFSIAYAEGANWNETHFKHDRFNMLLRSARSELDDANRREMYIEMQTIVSNEGGVVIPIYSNYVFAMTTKLQHDNLAANWDLDGVKGMERWWFA